MKEGILPYVVITPLITPIVNANARDNDNDAG